jgi:hypothetical protein
VKTLISAVFTSITEKNSDIVIILWIGIITVIIIFVSVVNLFEKLEMHRMMHPKRKKRNKKP